MRRLLLLISIILFSCNKNQITKESFDQFNSKFHSDSPFQISRINFPLKGKSVNGFDKKGWTQKEWEMLKKPIGKKVSKEFQIKTKINDSLVIEKIWIPNSGFHTETQFAMVDGKWYLTYYDDINL